MEVKINREIREYTEAVFFGLSLRQIIFSACALAVAVAGFFLLKPMLGTETTSWICILAAAPFAALGFVKYNGMTAEQFVIAWFKSEFLIPKKLTFHSTNTYYEIMKPSIEKKQKEEKNRQDKERFVVPKGVQDVIPITAIYDDGIFRVGKDKFTKTFKFTDINYAVASNEDKKEMFLAYSELLNSFDSGATTKVTINNRRLNRVDFERSILIPLRGDELDVYRKEYNEMLLEKATSSNSMVQDKYITVSVCKKNIEDARNYFTRICNDFRTILKNVPFQYQGKPQEGTQLQGLYLSRYNGIQKGLFQDRRQIWQSDVPARLRFLYQGQYDFRDHGA